METSILFTLEEGNGWIAMWLILSTSTAEAVVLHVFPVLLQEDAAMASPVPSTAGPG